MCILPVYLGAPYAFYNISVTYKKKKNLYLHLINKVNG
jgi:hypothetical protein